MKIKLLADKIDKAMKAVGRDFQERECIASALDLPILPKFCWICGHKFWGNKIYFIILNAKIGADGAGPRYVHKSCGEKENYNVHRLPIKNKTGSKPFKG